MLFYFINVSGELHVIRQLQLLLVLIIMTWLTRLITSHNSIILNFTRTFITSSLLLMNDIAENTTMMHVSTVFVSRKYFNHKLVLT